MLADVRLVRAVLWCLGSLVSARSNQVTGIMRPSKRPDLRLMPANNCSHSILTTDTKIMRPSLEKIDFGILNLKKFINFDLFIQNDAKISSL